MAIPATNGGLRERLWVLGDLLEVEDGGEGLRFAGIGVGHGGGGRIGGRMRDSIWCERVSVSEGMGGARAGAGGSREGTKRDGPVI